MASLKFSKTTIQALGLPEAGKRQTIYDTETPKLALRVMAAGKKVSRDRFLQADKLPRFFAAVVEKEPAMRDFILLALLTGARRANLCASP